MGGGEGLKAVIVKDSQQILENQAQSLAFEIIMHFTCF